MVHIAFVNVVVHLQILVYVLHIMHLVGVCLSNTRISNNGAKALIRNHARTGEGITPSKRSSHSPLLQRTIWVSSEFLSWTFSRNSTIKSGRSAWPAPEETAQAEAQDSEDGFVEAQRISTPLITRAPWQGKRQKSAAVVPRFMMAGSESMVRLGSLDHGLTSGIMKRGTTAALFCRFPSRRPCYLEGSKCAVPRQIRPPNPVPSLRISSGAGHADLPDLIVLFPGECPRERNQMTPRWSIWRIEECMRWSVFLA